MNSPGLIPTVVPEMEVISTIWPEARVALQKESHHVQLPSLPAILTKAGSFNSFMSKCSPTESPLVLMSVMLVDPAAVPPAIETDGKLPRLGPPVPRLTTFPDVPFAFKMVRFAP